MLFPVCGLREQDHQPPLRLLRLRRRRQRAPPLRGGLLLQLQGLLQVSTCEFMKIAPLITYSCYKKANFVYTNPQALRGP